MRLKRLELRAFGHFTNQILAFDSTTPGFHILFGPNEAGKSSSLRALKALLYGFPQQTPDNFLHSYDQLLVGGCLENSSGQEIFFLRRKKRFDDLLDSGGNPLDSGTLTPFLNGLEPEIFESLYGIDHDTLVRGGEEILAQKGEVGQALFAAGAGISSLGEVTVALDQEAALLFKPTGQKPEINSAIKRFKALKKEARQLSLSASEWTNHHKILEDARAKRLELEKDRDQKTRALSGLERLKQAIPELAAMESFQEQLTALGPVVHLPADFVEQHQQVSQEMIRATRQLENDRNRLGKLEAKQKAIVLNLPLLEHAETVDDFHQRLGEYRKGQRDRPERNGMRIGLKRDAAHLLQQVRPDLSLEKVEILRSVLTRKKMVQTLGSRYQAINQQLTLALKQRRLADLELKEVEKQLSAIPLTPNVDGLAQAVKLAQRAGNLDFQLAAGQADAELNREQCLKELKQAGLWSGDIHGLMELSFPLFETIQQFEAGYTRFMDELRRLEKERKRDEKELKKAMAEVKKAVCGGDLPSEKDLVKSRERREQGWQLLRKQWIDKEDITEKIRLYDPDMPLVNAYEKVVERADQIADRLRREADRIASAAAIRTQVETLEACLDQNNRDINAVNQQLEDLDNAWHRVWQPLGIVPLTPKEMDGWLTRMDKLRFKVGELFKKNKILEREMDQRNQLIAAVENELHAMEGVRVSGCETLESVLIPAEKILDRSTRQNIRVDKLKERHTAAKKAYSQASEDFEAAGQSLDQWQKQWQRAIFGLELEDGISTDEAIDLIEILQKCFDRLKEAKDLEKRISGIDRDAEKLEKEVRLLVEKVAPDMPRLPLDQTIIQLRTLLGQAQKQRTLYEKHTEEFETLQQEVDLASSIVKGTKLQMKALFHTAECETDQDLSLVISRHMAHEKLQEKLSHTRATLAKIGAGESIEVLQIRAAGVNPDELPGQILALESDIQRQINPGINGISQVIGEETALLATMNGSEKAAVTAEKMEQELAGIRRLAERYAQMKIASRILQQEIERYREEHQDPVLKIASGFFDRLTLGSFTGLKTDVNDRGAPVLVGIRPDNMRLTVDKMSSGTRDQLYLALRLATLEWRLETNEPMPFIVDDILINFDDERSRATLKILADLSDRNQVILFTHHRQIVDAAQKMNKGGVIHIHRL